MERAKMKKIIEKKKVKNTEVNKKKNQRTK